MNNEEYQEVTMKDKDFEKRHREQYKRDMMLQLVRNEALTETIKQLPDGNEFHKVIAAMADKLTEEAFK